ncbi:MAG: argininosuccinate lyase [Anaerovoracaceae bacterium]
MKLWKGRFSKAATSSADEFNASIEFDQRLYREDITGSVAHARMLGKQGIITPDESLLIVETLQDILKDIEEGKVEFTIESEDIHMNIESILTERIGDVGKKLHTARSRNDQVAVDIRLYLKKETAAVRSVLTELEDALEKLAKEHTDTVMPGYTHLQRAQPVTLAYHLLAYYQMFSRDMERFDDCLQRIDRLPLGSGALAGTTYDTDRDFLAKELGFAQVLPNGMDAVADRDFAIEFINCCAITMMHLSRFCEELILWSSAEFDFVEIDDSFSTGSSIMPQKKNPDMAELIRGKTGRVYGDLMSLLTICKGLPMAYNKDLQEDKIPVFDAADTLKASVSIFTEMILTMKVKTGNMEKAAKYGYMNATDAADYLVSKGLPFRDCHEIIGRMVLYCINKGIALDELTMEEFKSFSDKFDDDIYDKIAVRSCIKAKRSKGSTSFESVEAQLADIDEKKNERS